MNLCIYTCFVYLQPLCVTLDFKRFIDSIHILFLLYLLLWFWDFIIKSLQDFIKIYRALIKDISLSMANQAGTNLRHIRDRELSRRNRLQRPASFKVGDLVFVHHSRLPSGPRNCLQDPYFGPYRIIRIDGSRIPVRCSPRLGGELLCVPKQLRHYHSPDDLS